MNTVTKGYWPSADGPNAIVNFGTSNDIGNLLSKLLFDEEWYIQARQPERNHLTEATAMRHYLDVGLAEGRDPTRWFSEEFYRASYPDVQAGIERGEWRCGYQHYLLCGLSEFRNPSRAFNELTYLGRNSDVWEAIQAGRTPNGFMHYAWLGQSEGRLFYTDPPVDLLRLPYNPSAVVIDPTASFAEALYISTNSDVVDDGEPMPGLRHWLEHGLAEDLTGRRPRLADWVENTYLHLNPDLGPHIGPNGQPSGYSHFLMYGWAENRAWSGSLKSRNEGIILSRAMATRSSPAESSEESRLALISVIVPVYNPDVDALRACIGSVRAQTYRKWELCLADDGSNIPEVIEVLLDAERGDPRIHVVLSDRNAGISRASNLAFSISRGDVVALLDNDDLLAPDALLQIARGFASRPDVDMVYTDEGKITEAGELVGLNAKPGWSPDLLLATMYIGHLTAYRRSIVDRLGGFRPAFDGTQDYDLALRAAEIVRSVVHIPLPLYFWRMSPASTAGNMEAKPRVLQLQRLALESALLRTKRPGSVLPGHSPGHWKVKLDVPPAVPLVSIVIPTAGRSAQIAGRMIDLVVTCVQSLTLSETYPSYEIIVVHNGDLRSTTLLSLGSFPRVRLLRYKSEDFNLSDKINHGVAAAAGEFVLLLNDDMQMESVAIIQSMMGRMFDGVGVVGGTLLYANGALQHAGVVWTAEGPTHAMIGEHRLTSGPAERLRMTHDCFGVSGACMFFRRDVFLTVGGYAHRFPTNYNDVDFCLKLRAHGLRVVFNPDVRIYHFESVSKVGTFFWELQLLILSYPKLTDPYLNPNFLLTSPFYEIADLTERPATPYRAWMVSRIDKRRVKRPSNENVRFSFILSVYDTPAIFLMELQATLFNQTYGNWQLVLVDNGSRLSETIEWVDRVRSLPNVTFVRLEKNLGIMGGYGTAFRTATGDYVVPIDSDDLVTIDCLDVIAWFLETNGMPDAIYSDEDKADTRSNTHSPFLKPDWDPVLFTNMCFVAHVCAIRRDMAVGVGAYSDDAAAGCHDWDTFLRLIRAGARIMHLPEVLYSWRIHPGSTASIDTGNKPYTINSQKYVLDQHLRLTGLVKYFDLVQNELFSHNGMWRLRPLVPALPSACVVVIASSEPGRTARLLSDLAFNPLPLNTFLVIAAADDGTYALDSLLPEVLGALWPEGPARLAASLHDAIELCLREARIVAILNASVATLNRSWLPEALGMFAAAPDVGAVGGQVLLEDGRIAWRAGFAGMASSPDYGQHYSNSGYYGTGWCQRTCDLVPAVGFLVCPELLAAALIELSNAQHMSARHLAGYIGSMASEMRLRIVYTPFLQVLLADDVAVSPIVPRCADRTRNDAPRYYSASFGSTQRTAYLLADAIEG